MRFNRKRSLSPLPRNQGSWLHLGLLLHKRPMLLSFVALLAAAIARIPLDARRQAGIVAYFSTTLLRVLVCVAHGTLKHRRLHPAFAWGAGLVIVSWPLRLALTSTAAWMTFATWVTG